MKLINYIIIIIILSLTASLADNQAGFQTWKKNFKKIALKNEISEKIFDPSKDTPVSKHNIAGYHDKIFVLSVCNKHDTWLNLFYL